MRGLRNNGNTCYFNTSLQCLLNIPVLSNHLIDNPYTGECEFTKLYSELVNTYWSKTHKGVINAHQVLKAFQSHFKRFVIGEQHDVQEAIFVFVIVVRSPSLCADSSCVDVSRSGYYLGCGQGGASKSRQQDDARLIAVCHRDAE